MVRAYDVLFYVLDPSFRDPKSQRDRVHRRMTVRPRALEEEDQQSTHGRKTWM